MSHDLSWTLSASSSMGKPRRMHHARSRLCITSGGRVSGPDHPISLKFSGVRLAQDACSSTFDIHCKCDGEHSESVLSRDTKSSLVDKGVLTESRCLRSGSEGEAAYLVVGSGNLLASSSDLHIARVWIHKIAWPELYALSLDPG